jgi:hypothetical protein
VSSSVWPALRKMFRKACASAGLEYLAHGSVLISLETEVKMESAKVRYVKREEMGEGEFI